MKTVYSILFLMFSAVCFAQNENTILLNSTFDEENFASNKSVVELDNNQQKAIALIHSY